MTVKQFARGLEGLDYSAGQFEHNRDTQEDLYRKFGDLSKTDTTGQLKLYDEKRLIACRDAIEALPNRFSIRLNTFSLEHNPNEGLVFYRPNFKKLGYDNGYVWVYDPRIADASFKDPNYTWLWRIPHEIGHAIVEPFLYLKYGSSRRLGKLGRPHKAVWTIPDPKNGGQFEKKEVPLQALTALDCQRAVEWEDLAFRAQRILLEQCGVTISDEDFAREYNVNISDAVYRVVTGEFGNPGQYGMKPFSEIWDLDEVLLLIADAALQIETAQGSRSRYLHMSHVDLGTWRRTTDEQILAAIDVCAQKGLAYLHQSFRKELAFQLPIDSDYGYS